MCIINGFNIFNRVIFLVYFYIIDTYKVDQCIFKKYAVRCIETDSSFVRVSFLNSKERLYRKIDLIKFPHLQELLNHNAAELDLPETNMLYFRSIIELRCGYEPKSLYICKYFKIKEFVELYKLLTKYDVNYKLELFTEIKSFLKNFYIRNIYPDELDLEENNVEANWVLDLNYLYTTSLFFPVCVKYRDVSLVIKYIYDTESYVASELSIINYIHFEISYCSNEEYADQKQEICITFSNIIELIHNKHRNTPIYITLYTLININRNVIKRIYDFLKSKYKEKEKFKSIALRASQDQRCFKKIICFKYLIFNVNNIAVLDCKKEFYIKYISTTLIFIEEGFTARSE